MKVKTYKAAAKRFVITRKGKILHRAAGKNHFNARESGNTTRGKRRDRSLSTVHTRTVKILVN